jgi:hypothetical protein
MESLPTRLLAGIPVPDTPLITKALSFAEAHSTPGLYNHVVRSWLFGLIISRTLHPSLDLEAFSIATILHDLGFSTTPSLISPDKRFEVDGANATRAFLAENAPASEWDKHRIQLVWDTIALHTTASIALFKEPEVASSCAGIMADVVGPKMSIGGLLSKEQYDEVVKEVPLLGIKDGIKDVICGLCRTKPETTYDNFIGDFGEVYVEGYTRVGKRAVDLLMKDIEGT